MRDLPPVHPGEQLREEFMAPVAIRAYRLQRDFELETAAEKPGDRLEVEVKPRAA
jgi:plasmid maintenance system antidote protein VapI